MINTSASVLYEPRKHDSLCLISYVRKMLILCTGLLLLLLLKSCKIYETLRNIPVSWVDYSDVLLLSKVTKLREGTGPHTGGDRSPPVQRSPHIKVM